MLMKKISVITFIFFLAQTLYAQIATLQDPSLNNLVLPMGYRTCGPGDLGATKKSGKGKQAMILIAGLGFGADAFDSFAEQYKDQYKVYAVTPAGFSGTAAPAMPDTSAGYAAMTWTNGIVTGILRLIEKEKLTRPIIIAHFVTATQAAFSLAMNHPDKIGKIIIISGAPYRYYPGQKKDGTYSDWEHEKKYDPAQRAKIVEAYWAPQWFKTVTKKTWDDNMWTAGDYCKDSSIGEKLFRQSAEVPVQVMIRYLTEWMAYDAEGKYKDIKVPVLILIPDFRGILTDAKQYLNYFHKDIWATAKQAGNPMLRFETIPDTRIFMWYDNPGETYRAINSFLGQP
jgi:pimeloyl-ACP methyl ester carboxylesterase